VYAQERLIRDRFSQHACVKCGARHSGDDVLVLARRGAAWLIMLTCTHCQRRGVFVVSFPRGRRMNASQPENLADALPAMPDVAETPAAGKHSPGAEQRSSIEQPDASLSGADQFDQNDQITPLDHLEELEHAHYLATRAAWSELWPEPTIDRQSLNLPLPSADDADTLNPPDTQNTPPTLPQPTNQRPPRPEKFSPPHDFSHPPMTPNRSYTSPPSRPNTPARVTSADVDAIRRFLSRFDGDFMRLFGFPNPGEQL